MSPPSVQAEADAFPSRSCIERELSRGQVLEVAGIAPPDLRRGPPRPHDADWLPARLTDVAAMQGGFVVLDGPGHQVTVFSQDLRTRRQWGRRGEGPGELQRPAAVAVSPDQDTVWVLNAGPPRLAAFTRDGRFLRSVRLDRGGIDLAIDGQGNFYIAHDVPRFQLTEDGAPLVSVVGPDGSPRSPLVRITEADWHAPRVLLPLGVHVGVVAAGTRVAVVYPVGGVVDVYEGGGITATARACVPEALVRAYAEQADATQAEGQGWVRLVTGVFLDAGGPIRLVGPLRDSAGRFHVDVFDAQGGLQGSVVLPGSGMNLMSYPVFAGDPERLVSFNPIGSIAVFEIRPPLPTSPQ